MSEGVIVISRDTVIENPIPGTVIGTLSVEGGSGSYEFEYWSSDLNFSIDGNLLIVGPYPEKIDYEFFAYNNHYFPVPIRAIPLDDIGSVTRTLQIKITDVNDAPKDIILSSLKADLADFTTFSLDPVDIVSGTELLYLQANDQDKGDTHTYTLLDTAGGRFALDATGTKVVVANPGAIKSDQTKSYQLKVQAKDRAGLTFEKDFTVEVSDFGDLLTNTIIGTKRNNTLTGTDADEMIAGAGGNDKLNGKGGDDYLSGGTGKDVLTGGAGKDLFFFDAPLRKRQFDFIKDFKPADDTLVFTLGAMKVSKSVIKKMLKGDGTLAKKFFHVGKKAKDKHDHIVYDKKKGMVYFDQDGSGRKKDLVEVVKVKPGTKLTIDDFFIT